MIILWYLIQKAHNHNYSVQPGLFSFVFFVWLALCYVFFYYTGVNGVSKCTSFGTERYYTF